MVGILFEVQTTVEKLSHLATIELVAALNKTVMPPQAKAIPKSIPETINKTDRPAVKYPIGPTIVERTQRIRIQRGNLFTFQEPAASKSRPAVNMSAPTK